MPGRFFLKPTAEGSPGRTGRRTYGFALLALPAMLQPNPFGPAVDAAGRAFNSATFWSVLAFLLSIGCIYYLVRGLYERRILQQQENLNNLYALSETILESHDPAIVHKDIVEVSRLVADGTHCYLLLLNSSTQQLEYEAGTDSPPLSAVSLSAISGSVTCFRSQTLTEVPDAENCPFVKSEIVRRLGQKALLYVPIIAGGVCLGVIEVEDRSRKRIFSRQQKTRVRHVARLAALGLRLGDQRTLEANLHRTEKMSAVSELIEAMAETLVSPLKRIGDLAASGSANGAGSNARLEELARESRRAVDTVEQLANLANSRRGHPREVDLHQLLQDVHEGLVEDGRNVRLSLSRAPARIVTDPLHLEQVLVNLVRHAEHLLEGIGGNALQLSTNLLEKNVVVSIAPPDDAERGDPEPRVADHERLLEPESLLRLAVCQNLIEGFGGTLHIENRVRRGFRIELRYPVVAEPLRRGKAVAPGGSANGVSTGVTTALIIDPDPEGQDALLFILTERGYRAVPVATAEEGLDLCHQAQFDCVFCDARLIGAGTGIYERMRPRVSRFVFVVESTFNLDSAALPGDDSAVLYKPFDAADVDQVLEPLAPEPAESVEETEIQTAGA